MEGTQAEQTLSIEAFGKASGLAAIAPVPLNLAQTRVSPQLLKDLMLKHIYDASVLSINELSEAMALSGGVIEEVSQLLRQEALIELSSAIGGDGTLSFRLTDRGRFSAKDANERSGYLGPAPVTLEHYREISQAFSLTQHQVTQVNLNKLFSNFIIEQTLLDQLGAAFNSRKAIFVYGPAGTGKTFTIGKVMTLFKDECLIPHAIAIKDTIVQLFDPQIHQVSEGNKDGKADKAVSTLLYRDSHDRRFLACKRPIVVAGGELTADLLEVQFDPQTKITQAPLQLKANNGIFFIDDIGRQSISPQTIFNRWIVPMEEARDFLTLANGQHFEVPFDVQLVFSSNMNPLDLADEAVLRRIGFKINFQHLQPESYREIWRQEVEKRQISFDPAVVEFTLNELHFKQQVGLLPCHPRDLIDMALTQSIYKGEERGISSERINWAWQNYFVNLEASSKTTLGVTRC